MKLQKKLFVFAFIALFAVSCNSNKSTQNQSDSAPESEEQTVVEEAAPEVVPEKKEELPVGPTTLDLQNFKIKVPEGWKVVSMKDGSICSLELKEVTPPDRKDQKTNFGWSVDIWSFAHESFTVEKNVQSFLNTYKEGVQKPDVVYNGQKYKRVYFKEIGSTQELIAPLKTKGAIKIDIRSFDLNEPAIKEMLSSLELK